MLETKKYESPEEVFAACYELPVSDLQGAPIGAETEDGRELGPFTFEETIASIRSIGVWGFVDGDGCIHYWVSDDVEQRMLVHFFAHEIGHTVGEQDPDPLKEEARAEQFGHVAAQALDLAARVKAASL